MVQCAADLASGITNNYYEIPVGTGEFLHDGLFSEAHSFREMRMCSYFRAELADAQT